MNNGKTHTSIETIINSGKDKHETRVAREIVNYLLTLIEQGDIFSSSFKEAIYFIEEQNNEGKRERYVFLLTIQGLTDLFRKLKHDAAYKKRNLSIDQQLAMKKIKSCYCRAYVKLCLIHKDELSYTVNHFSDLVES